MYLIEHQKKKRNGEDISILDIVAVGVVSVFPLSSLKQTFESLGSLDKAKYQLYNRLGGYKPDNVRTGKAIRLRSEL